MVAQPEFMRTFPGTGRASSAMPAWPERQAATERADFRISELPWRAMPRQCGALAVRRYRRLCLHLREVILRGRAPLQECCPIWEEAIRAQAIRAASNQFRIAPHGTLVREARRSDQIGSSWPSFARRNTMGSVVQAVYLQCLKRFYSCVAIHVLEYTRSEFSLLCSGEPQWRVVLRRSRFLELTHLKCPSRLGTRPLVSVPSPIPSGIWDTRFEKDATGWPSTPCTQTRRTRGSNGWAVLKLSAKLSVQ